jgi:hypothetical protein
MKGLLTLRAVLTFMIVVILASTVAVAQANPLLRSPLQIPTLSLTPTAVLPTSIVGFFFPNPLNSGSFVNPTNTPTCTPQGESTRPFTDVVLKADGTCASIIAQGGGAQAGVNTAVASLQAFEALFTAHLALASAVTASLPWLSVSP